MQFSQCPNQAQGQTGKVTWGKLGSEICINCISQNVDISGIPVGKKKILITVSISSFILKLENLTLTGLKLLQQQLSGSSWLAAASVGAWVFQWSTVSRPPHLFMSLASGVAIPVLDSSKRMVGSFGGLRRRQGAGLYQNMRQPYRLKHSKVPNLESYWMPSWSNLLDTRVRDKGSVFLPLILSYCASNSTSNRTKGSN